MRRRIKAIHRQAYIFLGALLLASVAARAQNKKTILFDASHQQDTVKWALDEDVCGTAQRFPTPDQSTVAQSPENIWSGAFSALGVDLVKKGIGVETLPAGSHVTFGDKTNAQDLSNYAVYIIPEPRKPFTEAESAAIIEFVKQGGGLFMIADEAISGQRWDPPGVFNHLMLQNVFGIKFNNHSDDPQDLGSFDDSPDNILTTDVTSAILYTGDESSVLSRGLRLSGSTSMEISGVAQGHIWHSKFPRDSAKGVTLATSTYGSGRIAAVGDSSIAADTTPCKGTIPGSYTDARFDNKRILLNAIAWLAKVMRDQMNATVSITKPGNGAKVKTRQTITADAQNTSKLEFYVDRTRVHTASHQPFAFEWDSTSVANGEHTLTVKAFDAEGKLLDSDAVTVTVSNPTSDSGGVPRWILSLGALAVIVGAVILLWRRFARPTVTLAPDASDERAFSLTFKARLPCLSKVTWFVAPDIDVKAVLRDSVGTIALPTPETPMTFKRGDHRFVVTFSLSTMPKQSTEISVHIVAWPSFLRWPVVETYASRTLPAAAKPASLDNARGAAPPGEQIPNLFAQPITVEKEKETADEILPPLLYDDDSIERVVIDVANAVIRTSGVDRAQLVARLRNQGIRSSIATPFKVPESANTVFRKYWFEPDDRTGTWLWVPVNGDTQFIIIPFDLRSFSRSSMLSYLSSLYEGAINAQKSVSEATVRFISAARVSRGEGDSYRVVRRGELTPLGSGKTSGEVRWTTGSDAVDFTDVGLRVQRLESRVEWLESARSKSPDEANSRSPDSSAEIRIHELRQLTRRLDELTARIDKHTNRFEEQVKRLRSSVDDLAQRLESIENSENTATIDEPAFVPAEPSMLPLQPDDFEQAIAELDRKDFEFAPAPIPSLSLSGPGQPSLPRGWQQRLSRSRGESSFIDAPAYERSLRKAYEELRSLDSRDRSVTIVHLLPTVRGSTTSYEVHFREAVTESNGVMVFRCTDNPSARIPPQQFFIGWNHGEQVSVVCPPGNYSPVSFDLTPLIQNAPASSFTIEEIKQPATLERLSDGRYRVLNQMSVSIT